MSILDIIRGDLPLLKPTMKSRIKSIEQDYARLASGGGGRRYITDSCPQFKRELGPLVDALMLAPDEIHEDYINAITADRNDPVRSLDAYFFNAPNIIKGSFLGGDWKFDIQVQLPRGKYHSVYLVNSVGGWGSGAVGLQAGMALEPQFQGRIPPQQGGPAGSPLVGTEQLFPLTTSDGTVPHKVHLKFSKPLPETIYLTYGPTSGGSASSAYVFTLVFTDGISLWLGNMDHPGS